MVWPFGLLLLAPVVTHFRSLEAYGLVVLLTAIIGASPVLMAGTQAVLIQRLASHADNGRGWRDDGSIGAAMVLAAVVCGLVITLAGGWLAVTATGTPFELPAGLHDSALVAACAAGAIGVALDQISVGILKGLCQFRRSAQLELSSRGLQIAAAVAAAAWIERDAAPAMAVGWATLAGALLRAVIATRMLAWQVPPRALASAAALLRKGWWMVFGSLGGYLYMSLDRVIVGSLLGPRAVAVYGIGVQLAQFCLMLPAAYFQPLMPFAARCDATRDTDGLRRLVRLATLKALAGVAALAVGAALVAPWFVSQGLAHTLSTVERHMVWLCLGAASLMGLSVPAYHALMGLGRFIAVSLVTLAAGLIMVALLAWIGSDGNVMECAAARLAVGGFMLAAYAITLRHALKRDGGRATALPREVA